ncbi:hypothetical protein C3L33_13990, partial [Rhododendron williamsianum]
MKTEAWRCISSESSSISPPQDDEINGTLPSLCSSNAPIVEGELINRSMEADVDSIYQKYTERMRWFDLLNHDRTCGISRYSLLQVPQVSEMALFSEGATAKRLAREEEVLVEKRSKPSGSISREGNFVYNDRDEAGSRVLKMSLISTSQLKWCQEKLNDVKFEEERLRGQTQFPCFPLPSVSLRMIF